MTGGKLILSVIFRGERFLLDAEYVHIKFFRPCTDSIIEKKLITFVEIIDIYRNSHTHKTSITEYWKYEDRESVQSGMRFCMPDCT